MYTRMYMSIIYLLQDSHVFLGSITIIKGKPLHGVNVCLELAHTFSPKISLKFPTETTKEEEKQCHPNFFLPSSLIPQSQINQNPRVYSYHLLRTHLVTIIKRTPFGGKVSFEATSHCIFFNYLNFFSHLCYFDISDFIRD